MDIPAVQLRRLGPNALSIVDATNGLELAVVSFSNGFHGAAESSQLALMYAAGAVALAHAVSEQLEILDTMRGACGT